MWACNGCPAAGGCLADPAGEFHAKGACELTVFETAANGTGVRQLAEDSPQLGVSGGWAGLGH